MAERPKIRRCAIYTRKSSEEGLDQAYNSLDAQRDACAAYIASQKHEGWVLVEKHYDDGGFSGGSLDRPALQTLFADLTNGTVDIIVVYKIDRLTRSLADFAKLTELFDKHETSFVAVTQQFNTSTSMGRLTLNVLLSFAQFEREVAGERIRDKIAASKRRGMWMGGRTPIGYDVRDKKLIVNEPEAGTVRYIFKRYLELKSVKLLQAGLEQSGIRSKPHTVKDGTAYGASIMYRGALSYLLTNQIYRGVIAFKGDLYEGEHERIVPEELFQSVQTLLTAQGPGEAARKKLASPAILKGIVFDESGNRLQPTHSAKHGRKYRYYVSAPMIRDAKSNPEGYRIPASDLEKIVTQTVATRLRDRKWLSSISDLQADVSGFGKLADTANILAMEVDQQTTRNSGILNKFVIRIDVSKKTIKLKIDAAALNNLLVPTDPGSRPLGPSDDQHCVELIIAGQFLRCGKEVRLIIGNDDKANIDKRLLREIVQARKWFDDLSSGRANGIAELARRSGCNAAHVSRRISLAFLAPDVTNLIVSGTQPLSLTPERLKQACPLPVSWDDQRALLLD
jgi:site-specific DNA recombinase